VPRSKDKDRLHHLAQLIMCSTDAPKKGGLSELRQQANWKGGEEEGRKSLLERIQELMPATSMLPP